MTTQKTTELLKYTFTSDEILTMARESAQQTSGLAGIQETLREVSTQLKAQIAAHEKRINELARLINQGYEYRGIDCEWIFDEPKKGRKSLYRLDTGDLVRDEVMTTSDLQGDLKLEEA